VKRALSNSPWFAIGLAALAGADVERTCVGGVGLIERWTNIPAAGIQLDLARGIGSSGPLLDTRPAPGLPNNHAVAAQCGIAFNGLPIQQSIADGAATWNSATIPGTTAPATAFRINPTVTRIGTYPDWMTYSMNPFGVSLIRPDGRNQVTFWEPQAVMNSFGGLTLAVAVVRLAPGTGIITECDIAYNGTGVDALGNVLFRFVEDNLGLGTTIVTGATGVPVEPVVGYADLRGVMVHELGHLAGLAHSLIDGPLSSAGSETPTMFAVGQVTPYSGPVAYPLAGCTNHVTVAPNAAATQWGGILGLPARSLAQDDIAAISVAYPGPGQAQLGAILGRVRNAAGQNVRGAHVVAINAAAPELGRIGTFSDEQGNFRVGSLAPGNYWLMVERPDVNGYFAGTGLPEYVDPMFCGTPAVFETEFLDGLESANEATPLAALAISVSAGANTAVTDFLVEPVQGVRLTASSCANGVCTPASTRGTVHNDLGGVAPSLSLGIVGGAPNGIALIAVGMDRAYLPFGAQLIEVNTLPGGTATVALDPNGAANLPLAVGPGLIGTTFFAQAAELDLATGFLTLTNTVTLRLDSL